MRLPPDKEHIQRQGALVLEELRQKQEYRVALDDGTISEDDLQYLALFEATRKEIYRDGIENIDRLIIQAFGEIVGLPAAEAEERYFDLERRVADHYNTLRWSFGEYADRFNGPKQ